MNRRASARPQGGGKFATVTKYKSVLRPGHVLADKDGRVRVHRLVLYEKIGGGQHCCYWCSVPVGWLEPPPNRLVADHVDADKWNNAPTNLVPSCDRCNAGREKRARSRCKQGHLLVGDNLYLRPDSGSRQCRTCKADTFRRFSERRKITKASVLPLSVEKDD